MSVRMSPWSEWAGLAGVKQHATPLTSTSLINLRDLRVEIPTDFYNAHVLPPLPLLGHHHHLHPHTARMPPHCIRSDHDGIRCPAHVLKHDRPPLLQLHLSDFPRSLRERDSSVVQRYNRRILGRKWGAA